MDQVLQIALIREIVAAVAKPAAEAEATFPPQPLAH
jgi:hypothetical protein